MHERRRKQRFTFASQTDRHPQAAAREDDLPPDTRQDLAETLKASAENAAFLACLKARTAQGEGRLVGPRSGPNYAPAQFEGMPEAKGYRRAALRRAMDRLFATGRIESSLIENKKAGRAAHVIREVPEGSHNGPHITCTSMPHNDAHSPAQHSTTHTVDTTYQMGAASWPSTPNPDEIEWDDQEQSA